MRLWSAPDGALINPNTISRVKKMSWSTVVGRKHVLCIWADGQLIDFDCRDEGELDEKFEWVRRELARGEFVEDMFVKGGY